MRAGACSVQQTLTCEAASVLKHSLSLARRRGHAQVTPLHVAATLLSSRVSLLRRACLKSQPHQSSHPLHGRALELCFNVALNRLPTTPGPFLHGQPSLSNALIAALKRAQAHQRRGCIEQQQQQQQQPLLAIKVELEQLILSILDDPSVSRVMREAGFSSTSVKNNLEDSSVSSVFQCYNSSGGIYSTPSSPPSEAQLINPTNFWHSPLLSSYLYSGQNPLLFSPQKKVPCNTITDSAASVKEDMKLVIEILLRKKRKNTVIVGDSLAMTEGLVAELMAKAERGDVPEELKSVHFIKFQFSAAPLILMKREEVQMNISELKRKVESFMSSGGNTYGGVIIHTGDLKWTVDDTTVCEREVSYSPVDHLVAEIGKLLAWYNNSNKKVWLMATANYQTYIKCQMKQPPLDAQWALQAVSVPSGGLGLSLNATSCCDPRMNIFQSQPRVMEKNPLLVKEEEEVLSCCDECTSNYEKEAGFKSMLQKSSQIKDLDRASIQFPDWLKPNGSYAFDQKDHAIGLRRKWNKLCQSLHQGKHSESNTIQDLGKQISPGKNYLYSSLYSWCSNQNNFSESKSISFSDQGVKLNPGASTVPRFRRQQSCHIEFSFTSGNSQDHSAAPNLDFLKSSEGKEVKITLGLGNLSQSEGIKDLLQENVPWQSEIIPSITEALVDEKAAKTETWFYIQGNDLIGKRRLARGIAQSVFGSAESILCMNMRKTEHMRSQLPGMLEKALDDHEKLVVLVEDVELADQEFLNFLADKFETGKSGASSNKGNSKQTIFILTDNNPRSKYDSREDSDSIIQIKLMIDQTSLNSVGFCSDYKRKAEWDLPNKSKTPRSNNMEDSFSISVETGKKDLRKQLSATTLDLNIEADEDDDMNDGKNEGSSPISSDLTNDQQQNPLGFLEQIKNSFVFNRDAAQDNQIMDLLLCKIKGSFEEAYGNKFMGSFNVDQIVLEKMLLGCYSFLNSLFEKWLKDIFQTSLKMDDVRRNESASIRICLGSEKGGSCTRDGYKGSCLPKSIQVSMVDKA